MERSESIKNLAIALSKFQGSVGKVVKDATNPFFKSKYATLSNILDVISKPLSENGLAVSQLPVSENGLTTILMHESGEFIMETYQMKPVKNDPQGIGSSITYQRRYALGAVLGLNIDDDDDGTSASGNKTSANKPTDQKPTDQKPTMKDKKMFCRSDENLVNCLCDLVTGQNLCGKNTKKETWTMAQFETSLRGFTPEDYTWLVNRATNGIGSTQKE